MAFPADPFSTATHLAGAIIAALLAWPTARRGVTRAARIALLIFAGSAVTLMLASATFHALPDGAARDLFRRLDHAAIFILIAGTFTPLHTILFRGLLRWGVLAFIWTAAAAGVAVKTVFFDDIPDWLGVTAYVAMGWVGALTMGVLLRRHSVRYVSPLVLGGLAYTAGALCELTNEPTLIAGALGPHEVFHLAVLVGLGSMWLFIWRTTGDHFLAPTRVRRAPTHRADASATEGPLAHR